jgi:predicted metal-dependent hydrolase
MDVFKVPLILKPEERKTIQAKILAKECLIKFPKVWLKKKKYLVFMVDRIYWRLLAQIQVTELKMKTAELNRLYFGFNYHDVRYHRQFRRWGSCSTLKNINLSHRLIGAPGQLEDYVILHELAHLKYLNHGKDFWSLLGTTGFQSKTIRKDIELYGRNWQNYYYQWYYDLSKLV